MLNDTIGFSEIYIVCGRTDLRYGIDSLAGVLRSLVIENPATAGTLYLFCGRRSDRIKGLVWENVVIQEDKFSQDEWLAMKKTVDLFGRIKSTEQAEMMATVLYAYDELKSKKKKISDKDVYDFVMLWKPHWEQEKNFEVCDTIHNLAMLTLISVTHSNLLLDTAMF